MTKNRESNVFTEEREIGILSENEFLVFPHCELPSFVFAFNEVVFLYLGVSIFN